MLPIYSIESWLALRYRANALLFETLRDCYEAYTVFSFLYYLISLLGEEQYLITMLKDKSKVKGLHLFPISLFTQPWLLGPEFLHNCKIGVLQYVVVKNLMSLLMLLGKQC